MRRRSILKAAVSALFAGWYTDAAKAEIEHAIAKAGAPLIDPPNVKAGHVFVCENGHPACEALVDIEIGSPVDHRTIGHWRFEAPKIGGPWPVCPQCGSQIVFWVRDDLVNGRLA